MKKRKLNKKKLVTFIFICLFLVLFMISIIKIINYFHDNNENKKIQVIINKAIVIPKDTINTGEYKIDFETLKKQNKDTIAYLKVNNTKINYVVVKGNDNDYYLNHNFNKNVNVSGWIFADYRNKFNGNDKNIIIYGHNMLNDSMFGTLNNVLEKEWYENKDNHKILFVTSDGTYYYEVFSTYMIGDEDYYISTNFDSDKDFETFIKTLKFRSVYNYETDVSKDDKILTLSTCNSDGKKRIVLHAKLIADNND